ncbi:membrane dipeptidase [Rossellomorea vietnamensis]|uniref:Membrane dipeptidase n=2 Tax=Rossellomorea TaxID=2837508 RepID=A0A5D4KM93_9BACI|nr:MULTISPECIES: dipeptidase [Rossellomorea]TYR77453.1 membrane dipeptidase [Rossellomorea vietnamensis]TYS82396.1 membrane dipeptidase [Rossellomorea aquimaris]
MIFDAHCDVLLKLHHYREDVSFQSRDDLHITYPQLLQAGSKVQLFAIYLPSYLKPGQRFQAALEMVEVFHEKILEPNSKMKMIRSKSDIARLEEDEIGAMLTLEGCEAIEEDLTKLFTLYQLGVRAVGLTWNWANAAADGALEPRAAGLTKFGRETVQFLNEHNIMTDVSHLCERSFWDTIEIARYPIASHSNTFSVCSHPRNLKDEQIKALFQKNGVMGLTFVPQFLKQNGDAEISDILHHLDHACSLGGKNQVGFGSDFDGISQTVEGLSCYREYENLTEALQKHYTESQVKKFLFENFYEALPEEQ